ncbi:tRNA methyltransferase, has a role in tRNA modification [Orobanche minor]
MILVLTRRGIKEAQSTISCTNLHLRGLCAMKQEGIDNSFDSSSISQDKLPVLPPIATKNIPKCTPPSKVQTTPEIEKKYVHRVYDAIAPHFSSTRFAKWPKVQTFLNSLPAGSLILDAGCGNGKYLGLNPNCYFIGCDISGPLISICSDKGHEVLVADAVNLPYRTGYGDAAISIAVLHHLSTESRRKGAVEELIRVVKKGGLVLITVWAREQEDKALVNKWTPLTQKYLEDRIGSGSPRVRSPSSLVSLESIPETEEAVSREPLKDEISNPIDGLESINEKTSLRQQEYFVPWHLPYHRAEVSGASVNAVANGLARKDDKKGAMVYDRYYHVFSEGELERLACSVDGAVIVDRFYDKSNWCIILEKTSS